jgi:adenylyltransferase/sulfurtransferase
MELTPIEKDRYARQIVLANIGLEGQLKLKQSKVYVIGAGGLGSSLLLYLAAAGFAEIIIIDGDHVQLNNLQRQIIFNQTNLGENKAEVAKAKLLALNEHIKVTAIPLFITTENINTLLQSNSLIADCTDNFKARYLINDYAVANNCAFVSAAVYKHQLQFGVYNFLYDENKRSATFRCAFPEQNIEDIQDTCAQTGVVGVVPGIAGVFMANEIIKMITHSKSVQYNKLMLLDLHLLELKHIKIHRKVST